ncbi:MAG: hypothetical protein ACLRFM_03265 [Alphaproteobacteria bacterium]
MAVKLKKLNFCTVVKNGAEMCDLVESNRTRLSPYFWWTDEKLTPNKLALFMFVILYLMDTKRKKIAHKLNPQKLYDEQFVIYNEKGGVAGLCGLDNIDTMGQKNAELWALTFSGNPFGMVDSAIRWVEKYSASIKLDSLYAHVQLNNDKSKVCLKRNNYVTNKETKEVMVSKIPYRTAPVQVFTKILTKGEYDGR